MLILVTPYFTHGCAITLTIFKPSSKQIVAENIDTMLEFELLLLMQFLFVIFMYSFGDSRCNFYLVSKVFEKNRFYSIMTPTILLHLILKQSEELAANKCLIPSVQLNPSVGVLI